MDKHGFTRESAITDGAVQAFSNQIGVPITHDDLFYYVYGILHCNEYRTKYAKNLKKQIPRIPLAKTKGDFLYIAIAGKYLSGLHVDYDSVPMYPVSFECGGWVPPDHIPMEKWFAVENKNMRNPKGDLSRIIYNSHITVSGIPQEAWSYIVNGKPAIKWVMIRQRVKTDKQSGLLSDANIFARDTMHDPSYPLQLLLRVMSVSIRTSRVMDKLGAVQFDDMAYGVADEYSKLLPVKP